MKILLDKNLFFVYRTETNHIYCLNNLPFCLFWQSSEPDVKFFKKWSRHIFFVTKWQLALILNRKHWISVANANYLVNFFLALLNDWWDFIFSACETGINLLMVAMNRTFHNHFASHDWAPWFSLLFHISNQKFLFNRSSTLFFGLTYVWWSITGTFMVPPTLHLHKMS